MDSELKKFLNSLKCPICGAQIDIKDHYGYGCSSNQDHYGIYIHPTDNPPRIIYEYVHIYDNKYKYSITKDYELNGNVKTTIICFDIDQEKRVIYSFKDKKLTFDMDLFNFRNFNEKAALNRIKTIFVFR